MLDTQPLPGAQSTQTASLTPEQSNLLESIDQLARSSSNDRPISTKSQQCLHHLASFSPSPAQITYPKSKLAAVLILLHLDARGDLAVTLTTRSMTLRSHPGDTCLPGGKFDESDESLEATALREANEEIHLPLTPSSTLVHLTTLPAFTSRTLLVVIPIVYFLAVPDPSTILSQLTPNPSEVDEIFHVPLEAFLGFPVTYPPTNHTSSRKTRLQAEGSFSFSHSFQDLYWPFDTLYRLHSFANPQFPAVTGLTADILISVALIGYHGLTEVEEQEEAGTRLGFGRRASGQLSWAEIVKIAVSTVWEKGREIRVRKEL